MPGERFFFGTDRRESGHCSCNLVVYLIACFQEDGFEVEYGGYPCTKSPVNFKLNFPRNA